MRRFVLLASFVLAALGLWLVFGQNTDPDSGGGVERKLDDSSESGTATSEPKLRKEDEPVSRFAVPDPVVRRQSLSWRAELGGLRGRLVWWQSGEAIPGIRVECFEVGRDAKTSDDGHAQLMRSLGVTTSDERGRFEVAFARCDVAILLGIDLGGELAMIAPVQHSLSRGTTTDIGDVRVSRRAAVTGRVIDARGKPLAGALVTALDMPLWYIREPRLLGLEPCPKLIFAGGAPRRLESLRKERIAPGFFPSQRSAKDGRFEIRGLRPGGQTFVVKHPSRPGHTRRITVRPQQTLELGDVRLGDGRSAKLQLLGAGKEPLRERAVEVAVRSREGWHNFAAPLFAAKTNNEGWLELTGLAEGDLYVCTRIGPTWAVRGPLKDGARVVFDANCTLRIAWRAASPSAAKQGVAGQGAARAKGAAATQGAAAGRGAAATQVALDELQIELARSMRPVSVQVSYDLAGVLAFAGWAITGSNSTLAEAHIARHALTDGKAVTLEDGRTALEWRGLEPGSWQLMCRARAPQRRPRDGKGSGLRSLRRVQLRSGQVTLVELDQAATPCEFCVRGAQSRRVGGARIRATRLGGTKLDEAMQLGWCDEAGVLSVASLPLGPAILEVEHPGYAPKTERIKVSASQTRFTIELEEAARVRGIVRVGGRPAKRRHRILGFGPARERANTYTSEGRFALSRLTPGAWRFEARLDSEPTSENLESLMLQGSEGLTLKAQSTLIAGEETEVVLEAPLGKDGLGPATLSGTVETSVRIDQLVVALTGKREPGAVARSLVRSAVLDASGSFAFEQLRHGTYDVALRVRNAGFGGITQLWQRRVEIKSDTPAPLRIRLQVAELHLRLRDDKGRPGSNHYFGFSGTHASRSGAPTDKRPTARFRVTSDSEGRVRVAYVPWGEYVAESPKLAGRLPFYLPPAKFEVKGARVVRDLRIIRARRVRGLLDLHELAIDAPKSDGARFPGHLKLGGPTWLELVPVGRSGRWTFEADLVPARWRLSVVVDRKTLGTATLVVPPRDKAAQLGVFDVRFKPRR